MTMSLTGEPDESKGSRPVRWGVVGKVPDVTAISGNSLATYPVQLPSRPPFVAATDGVGVKGTMVYNRVLLAFSQSGGELFM